MTNKVVKRHGVAHITPDGKVISVKMSVSSDLHFDIPRGSLGGHIDDEPFKPALRESKED